MASSPLPVTSSLDSAQHIKLLLHGQNGSFPLLTPYLLQKYFPPKSDIVKNHLVLGIAVKDSFVVPVFPTVTNNSNDGNKNKLEDSSKKRKRNENEDNNIENTEKRKCVEHQDSKISTSTNASEPSDDKAVESAAARNNKSCKDSKKKNRKKKFKVDPKKPAGFTFQPKSPTKHLRIPSRYSTFCTMTFDPLADLNTSETATTVSSSMSNVSIPKQQENLVVLCTPHGQQKITPELYAQLVKHCGGINDATMLFDSVWSDYLGVQEIEEVGNIGYIRQQSSKIQRDVQRTNEFMDSILKDIADKNDRKKEEKTNSNNKEMKRYQSNLWGAVVGGSNMEQRAASASRVGQQCDKLRGAVIVGWHHIPSRKKRLDILERCKLEMLQSALSQQKDGTRTTATDDEKRIISVTNWAQNIAVLATKDILQITDAAVKGGVTMIGTALPLTLALSKRAIVLNFCDWRNSSSNNQRSGEEKQEKNDVVREMCYMDLSDTKYTRDFSPILRGCSCMACCCGRDNSNQEQNYHSRSYIHHLINTSELLAKILLFGHNLHCMLLFYREMSIALKEGKGELFLQYIEKQVEI